MKTDTINKAQFSAEITTPKSAAGARVVPLGPVVIPPGSGPRIRGSCGGSESHGCISAWRDGRND